MHIKILFWCFTFGLNVVSAPEPPKLVWSDEFDKDGKPGDEWIYDLGNGCPKVCGWGNNELQYYTSDKKNIWVSDGKLVIEVKKEDRDNSKYTSARIKTGHGTSWQYGYFEIRAKLPAGRGTWPAIWMLPDSLTYGGWPASGEIDIMEHVGFDQNVVHGTVHTLDFNHIKGTQVGKQKSLDSVHDTFHTYAINWTKDRIEFYIDGEAFHTFENNGKGFSAWPFDQRFHLILNIAVGGGWGGMKGVDESIWPQRMEVDYVRVYEPLLSQEQKQMIIKRL
jgi:beta-glucanase (GH16 family)